MNVLTLLAWVCTFVSFAWGVFCFFTRSPGRNWRTTVVARFGLIFAIWQAVAIATADANPLRHGAAIGMLAGSLILFWSAVRACGGERLTAIFEKDRPGMLLRHGPYRYIRHPFYTAYTIFWIAGALAGASIVSALAAVVMWTLYVDAIRREERKFADSPLAALYDDYRRGTGRMLPKLLSRPGRRAS